MAKGMRFPGSRAHARHKGTASPNGGPLPSGRACYRALRLESLPCLTAINSLTAVHGFRIGSASRLSTQ